MLQCAPSLPTLNPDFPHDTAPIRAEERFDQSRVAEYLRARLPDVGGDVEISFEQFPGGKANLTYLVRAGSQEFVLRRPPLGPVAPGSHDMAREHNVLSRLWRQFPHAPRAHLFCDDPDVMDKPFFVMDRVHGYVVRDEWPQDIDEARRRAVSESLVDTLVRLHAVDSADVDLSEIGKPVGFVERQVAGWTDRWNRAKTRDLNDMDESAALLKGSVPEPQAATLLHNDFKLDNTMIDHEAKVVAVLDWDMATLGDPLVDVGTMLAYWAAPQDAIAMLVGTDAVTLTPHMDRVEVGNRYAAGTGFDLSNVDYYLALAYFRIAVITEQIYGRFLAGHTNDARFEALGPLVPSLAASARSALG